MLCHSLCCFHLLVKNGLDLLLALAKLLFQHYRHTVLGLADPSLDHFICFCENTCPSLLQDLQTQVLPKLFELVSQVIVRDKLVVHRWVDPEPYIFRLREKRIALRSL